MDRFKVVLLFLCFFVAVSNVSAEENENTGYAECWYKIDKKHYEANYGSHAYGTLYVQLKVSKVNTITKGCYRGSLSSAETGYCSISGYTLNDIVKALHPEPKKYQCPSEIYLGGDYEKINHVFSSPEYKYTEEGLRSLKLSLNKKSGIDGNRYWTKASLEIHYILSEEKNGHTSDETGVNVTGDKSDHKQGTPADTSSPNSKTNLESIINWGKYGGGNNYEYGEGTDDCLIIKGDIKKFLDYLFIIISVVGIILLVIMSATEFIKVITGSDEDGIKKAFKHTLTRVLCIVILLLLPMIVSFIINIINSHSDGYTIGTDGSPICGIGE